MKTRYIWLLPAAVIALFLAFLAALPSLVASTAHRATIESLASSLTGRNVQIRGSLSLNLFPEPQLIAERVTIAGPHNETITAKALTLDISLPALIRGRLAASSLTLQSPNIDFPWPLPGGAAAIAPAPWLTALHAQIADGQISVGALTFQHVNADIYTGGAGTLSIAGASSVSGLPIQITLSLAGLDSAGSAPVSIDASAGAATIHLSGTFNAASTLNGTISCNTTQIPNAGALGQPATATAAITANPDQISLTRLSATQGNAHLTGTATLALSNPILSLTLAGTNLAFPGLTSLAALAAPPIPVYFALEATGSTIAGTPIPHLSTRAELSSAGADISALNATLPGNSALSLTGTLDPTGRIAGHTSLDSNNLSALITALGANVTAPDAWRQSNLTARIAGTLTAIQFPQISGTLGPGYMTGTLLLDRATPTPRLAGALHFDTLDLTPFQPIWRQQTTPALTADLEITADHALYQNLPLSRLLIDASFADQLVVRRATASLYNGILAASFTVAPTGDISAARAVISLPSASPLASLIPTPYQPPAAVTNTRLNLSLNAAGPPAALHTSITITFGQFEITAAPTIDLANLTAAGPLTLRHPNAIAAAKLFNLPAGLPWPGAGSISLRANAILTATTIAIPSFALSLGDLTATGTATLSNQKIQATLTADTLALPPWPADPTPIWAALSGATGKIALTANRVLLAGTPILGPSNATITLQPNSDTLNIANASLANGALTAQIDATTAPATPPSLAIKFALANADASQFALPTSFPITLPTGAFALQGNLTAAGYGVQTWLATLAGPTSLTAKSGAAQIFNLPALATALATLPREQALTAALQSGATSFNTLSVTGTFDHGLYTLTAATLQSPSGTLSATGNIDLPDQGISLNLAIQPAVPNPPTIDLALVGPWSHPQKVPTLREALAWTSPH